MPNPFRQAMPFVPQLASQTSDERAGHSPPNIILMMSDDQGWGDVGFNGNEVLRTPHLDAFLHAAHLSDMGADFEY